MGAPSQKSPYVREPATNRGGATVTRPQAAWQRRTGAPFKAPDAPSSLRTLTQQNARATRTSPIDRAPAGSPSHKDYADGFGGRNGGEGGNRGNDGPLGFSFTRDDDHFTAASIRYGDKSLNYLHVDDDYYPLGYNHFGHYYGHHHDCHHGYPCYVGGYYDSYSPLYWPGYSYCAPRYGYAYASVYLGSPYIYEPPYYGGYVGAGYVDYGAYDDYDDDDGVVIYGDDVYVNEDEGTYVNERNSDYGAYAPPPAPSPTYAAPPAQELEPFGDRGTPYGEIQPVPQGAQTAPPQGTLAPDSDTAANPGDLPQGPPQPVDESAGWGPVLTKGNDAFAAGDYDEAKRLYIQAIMVDERDGYAKMLYAWANFALRDYELAATSIRRALLTTKDLMQYPLDVRSLYKDVNVFEAQLRDLQKHVFDKPEDREATLLLAYLYFSIGEPQRAEAFLAELSESDGKDETVKQLRDASVKAQEILRSRQQGQGPQLGPGSTPPSPQPQ